MLTWGRRAGSDVRSLLVVFPLGMLSTAVLFEAAALASKEPVWGVVARWDLVAGVLGGGAACGLVAVDLLATTRGTPAARLGSMRAVLHVAALALFIAALVISTLRGAPSTASFALSAMGLALAWGAAWVGAQLAGRFDQRGTT